MNKNAEILAAVLGSKQERETRLQNVLVMLWSDYDLDLGAWRGYLAARYPGLTDEYALNEKLMEENQQLLIHTAECISQYINSHNRHRVSGGLDIVAHEETHRGNEVSNRCLPLWDVPLCSFLVNECCSGGYMSLYLTKEGNLCAEKFETPNCYVTYTFRGVDRSTREFWTAGVIRTFSLLQFMAYSQPLGAAVALALGLKVKFETEKPSAQVAIDQIPDKLWFYTSCEESGLVIADTYDDAFALVKKVYPDGGYFELVRYKDAPEYNPEVPGVFELVNCKNAYFETEAPETQVALDQIPDKLWFFSRTKQSGLVIADSRDEAISLVEDAYNDDTKYLSVFPYKDAVGYNPKAPRVFELAKSVNDVERLLNMSDLDVAMRNDTTGVTFCDDVDTYRVVEVACINGYDFFLMEGEHYGNMSNERIIADFRGSIVINEAPNGFDARMRSALSEFVFKRTGKAGN